MTPLPTQGIPSTATAGDTWRWRLDGVADTASYPAADGWTLTVKLRGPSAPAAFAVDRTSGDVVTIAAASSAPLLAGLYTATVLASRGAGDTAERYPVGAASLVVAEDPGTAGIKISHAAKCLALIDDVIEGRIAKGAPEVVSLLGQSITKAPLTQLYGLRNRYRLEVSMERTGGRLAPLRARFARA